MREENTLTKEKDLKERLEKEASAQELIASADNIDPSILANLIMARENTNILTKTRQRTMENGMLVVRDGMVGGRPVVTMETVKNDTGRQERDLSLFVGTKDGEYVRMHTNSADSISFAPVTATAMSKQEVLRQIRDEADRKVIERDIMKRDLQSRGFGISGNRSADERNLKEFRDGGDDRSPDSDRARALGIDDENRALAEREAQEELAKLQQTKEKEEEDKALAEGMGLFAATATAAALIHAPEFTTDMEEIGQEREMDDDGWDDSML